MGYIEIHGFTKIIKKKLILDEINLSLEKGKIYGLYGRNGSGKTMLLRAIAGLIRPTSGSIVINGNILHKDISFPESVGVIIENVSLLPQFDAFTNLKNLSKIKKVATDDDIKVALTKVGLNNNPKKVHTYSLGMRQKLAIAQAIFENPKILLLDEPTNGLDEISVQNIKQVLLAEKEKGTVIVLASHNIEDLRYLSDEIIYMSAGKVDVHDSSS